MSARVPIILCLLGSFFVVGIALGTPATPRTPPAAEPSRVALGPRTLSIRALPGRERIPRLRGEPRQSVRPAATAPLTPVSPPAGVPLEPTVVPPEPSAIPVLPTRTPAGTPKPKRKPEPTATPTPTPTPVVIDESG